MKCGDCGKEKDTFDKVNILIYGKSICQDCVDERENMALAEQTKKHLDWVNSVKDIKFL